MTGQTPLRISKLPFLRGLTWFTGSWALIKEQPIRLMLISLFFQFFLGLSQVPALGLLVVLSLPLLSAGLLQAFAQVERGQKPMLAILFSPFTVKKSFSRLLLLGAVVIVLGLLIVSMVLAGQMVDIDPEILGRIEQGDIEAIQFIDPKIIENAILSMMLGAAISGCITYFSVPLIWFRQQGMTNAIISGLKALALNWKPLLVLGLLLGLLAIPFVLLFASFYLSALGGGASASWLGFLLMLLGPVFQLMLFGTQYLAFKDIYGQDETASVHIQTKDNQLVA